jgi:hypothetical protein
MDWMMPRISYGGDVFQHFDELPDAGFPVNDLGC